MAMQMRVHGAGFCTMPTTSLIINNYIDEIHPTVISNTEGHGVGAWSFSRNLTVRNNFISASTINSLVGGASAPFQGHFPMFLHYIGNHFKKHPHYSTDNYSSNPAGTALPGSNNVRGQTFHQTNTDELYIWTVATGGAWRKVARPFDSPVCFDGRKWRNLTNDTIWDCVNGRWQAGGTDIMAPSVARTSTSVTAASPTQIFFSFRQQQHWSGLRRCMSKSPERAEHNGAISTADGRCKGWTATVLRCP